MSPRIKSIRIVAFVAAGAVGVAVLLFAFARPIAERLTEAYFASEGTRADVSIDHWDRDGLSARVTLGDEAKPDFDVRSVVLTFDRKRWLPYVTDARIVGPRLRLRADQHGLSYGSLQKLVDSFVKSPPTEDSWSNRFVSKTLNAHIEQARVTVDTPAGPIALAGSAEVVRKKLVRIDADVRSGRLDNASFALHIDKGAVHGRWSRDSLALHGEVAASGTVREAAGRTAPEKIAATFDADGLVWTSKANVTLVSLRSAALNADATHVASPLMLDRAHIAISLTDAHARNEQAHWSGSTAAILHASAQSLRSYGIASDGNRADFSGSLRAAADGRWSIVGSLHAQGGISDAASAPSIRAIPLLGADPGNASALVRAAHALSLDASVLRIAGSNGSYAIALDRPAVLASASGARLTVSALPGETLVSTAADRTNGKAAIAIAGGGLPDLKLVLSQFVWIPDEKSFETGFWVDAGFSTRSLRGVSLSGRGQARRLDQTIEVTLDRCADLRLAAFVANGKPTVRDARGKLCPPAQRPLLSSAQPGWVMQAKLDGLGALLPLAQARLRDGSGTFALAGGGQGLKSGAIAVARWQLSDLAGSRRFEPVALAVKANYANGAWRGTSELSNPLRHARIGTVSFTHTVATGTGEARIDARNMAFAPKGLEPADLSPLLAAVAQADGHASFTGHVAWTPSGMASGGQLDVDGLKFVSPMGSAKGTSTHIVFVSLVPIRTAPDQTLALDRIEWMSPLTGIGARFVLGQDGIDLGGARAALASGAVTIDPLIIGATGKPIAGTLRISNVDIGTVLAASNLASKVHLQARINGTIPFSLGPDGIRFKDGVVTATAPGRLAIERSLWAGGGASLGANNAMRDMAFQALENLAFDRLEGRVNSLPGGRLGLVLQVVGRADPPRQEETRVDLFSLIRGNAFDKPLAVPKGTPINLTLDTSLNFDELLRAYRNARSPDVSVVAH